jgi:hypothetical protein
MNVATQTTVPPPSSTPKLSKQVMKHTYSSCTISPWSIETSRNRLNSLRNENLNVNQAFLPFPINLATEKESTDTYHTTAEDREAVDFLPLIALQETMSSASRPSTL